MNPATAPVTNRTVESGEQRHTEMRHLIKYVSFMLNAERYALSAAKISEVLRYTDITPVPGSPDFILGIINLRGNVVTVVDARTMFGLERRPPARQSRIIVVEIEDFIAGVLVDQVAAVIDLDASCIDAAPDTGDPAAVRFIRGVYNMEMDGNENALYILVDFDKVTELLPH